MIEIPVGDAPPPPPGFEVRPTRGHFTRYNGPTFHCIDRTDLRQGMWVLDRHLNGMGFMHGGMICAFADSAIAMASFAATQKQGVTIKLSLEYFETISQGSWIEARPEVTMTDGELVHVTAPIYREDGKLAARASGIFRTVKRKLK